MADVAAPTTRKDSAQLAGLIIGVALALNAAFFFLSKSYYVGRPKLAAAEQLAAMGRVRLAFAVLTLSIMISAIAALFAPRLVGHALAIGIGIASFVGGITALASSVPPVLGLTLIVCGMLLGALAAFSLRFSRPSWAFLIAMLAVLATVTFFGAPKIRHLLDIGLWYALIIPGLQIVAVIALAMVRGEYKTRA